MSKTELIPNLEGSLTFLQGMHPAGPWHLAYKPTSGGSETRTFEAWELDPKKEWFERKPGGNHYFHVNRLKEGVRNKKASKDDVEEASFLHVDIDDPSALERIQALKPRPTAVVFSGGGFHVYYRLAVPSTDLDRVERCNKALARKFGGDNCHDVSRLLRVAGTVNHPDEKKAATGRTVTFAHVVQELTDYSRTYSLDMFEEAADEQSRAQSFERDGRWRVGTAQGVVVADHLVMATNITVKSPVGYANKTQPRSHVVLAFRVANAETVDGMFISIDSPTHSIRTGRDSSGPLTITVGPRFDTGGDGDVAGRFRDLEGWAREHLPVQEVAWRWCNEDYDTADRRPFVGQPDREKSPEFYVATGFNGWGISNGTAAGLAIAEEIASGAKLWERLYDPCRPVPEDFHKSGDTQSLFDDMSLISPGMGGVITAGEEKIAVWRDGNGDLYALSASCTHKGCTVTWNNADRTWDCPCHGSIYAADGEVIHGPARKPLQARPVPLRRG
jgi:nitrite reductase/ring-hydroxylating ferredoxin subunit